MKTQHKIQRKIITVIGTALLCSVLPYATTAEETANTVAMVSGGVGDHSMEAIIAEQKDYNLKLIFTEPNGEYLADIHVVIKDNNGNIIADKDSVGPVLLVKLKAGSYTINSSNEQVTTTRKVRVHNGKLGTYYIKLKETDS